MWSANTRTASTSRRAAKNWNVPTRTWLCATRVSTAPGVFSVACAVHSWPMCRWVNRFTGAPETIVSLPYINEPTRSEFRYYLSQASRIVATRERIGRFTSLEEVVAYSGISEPTVMLPPLRSINRWTMVRPRPVPP